MVRTGEERNLFRVLMGQSSGEVERDAGERIIRQRFLGCGIRGERETK